MTDRNESTTLEIDPTKTTTNDDSITSSTAANKLQKRLEMPTGEKPAAKVVRRSGRPIHIHPPNAAAAASTRVVPKKESIESNEEKQLDSVAVQVVGSVMERPRQRQRHQGTTAATTGATGEDDVRSVSRFSQSRRQIIAPPSSTGFPSLQIPLGALVQQGKGSTSNNNPLRTLSTTPSSAVVSTTTAATKAHDLESLKQASSTDAQALLAEMSGEEIQESVQELQSSLDPSIIAFLKKRGRTNTKQSTAVASGASNEEANNKLDGGRTNETTTTKAAASRVASADKSTKEKMEMAELMSSIRNYEDMDAAYEAFQQHMETDASIRDDGVANHPAETNVPSLGEHDFAIACDLLRSTSPQQTLWAARIVCRRLERDQKNNATAYSLCPLTKPQKNPWPFPTLLPVSLRCLLDANVSHRSGGMLQTTYVLKSLYALLQLRACADHVVDVTGATNNEAVYYQLNWLDDAVPSPTLNSCYAAAPLKPVAAASGDNKDLVGAVYATSSSSISAQTDGEAFVRDPMWTLLSRMRIIPRLAQILREGNKLASIESDAVNQIQILPVEALVAICGILAMVGQRSPGAASAVVQHPTMMDDLISLTLVRKAGCARYDPVSALPTVILMSTLARQSRVAAEGLDRRTTESSFFFQELASGLTANCADFQLQQWTVVLWRTLLRYGLGFTILPTMLTLAAPHLTLGMGGHEGQESAHSLSPELYTSFTGILNCVRVLKMQASNDSGTDPKVISDDQRSILSNAAVWLSSSKRQAVQHLKLSDEYSLQNCDTLRFLTSILRYLHALLVVTREDDSESPPGEFKAEAITVVEEESCIESLGSVVQSKCMSSVVNAALHFVLSPDFIDNTGPNELSSVRFEACASSFLDALLALATALVQRIRTSKGLLQKAERLVDGLERLLVSQLESKYCSKAASVLSGVTVSVVGTARRHWLNRMHATIVGFLNDTKTGSWNDVRKSRAIAFAVIGRLGRGDERTAAILFSYDHIFRAETPTFSQQPSPVSTLLVRELCRTPRSRHQLDHSFRLHNGLGIAADGLGPFGVQCLLSEAEDMAPGRDASDHLLPIGQYWLWHLLAGSVIHQQTPDKQSDGEATEVLLSTLQIIDELESCKLTDNFTYASRLSVGPKLYHLANICLHDEGILSHALITARSNALFDQYFFSVAPVDCKPLAEECRKHLDPRFSNDTDKSKPLSSLTEEEQVKAILEPVEETDLGFSTTTVRSLEAFVGDLCDAYLDYGAQYSFFSKCVRLFLVNGFPTKIRCLVVNRVRGALHLLTLESDGELHSLLRQFISGGLPQVDKSGLDPPELVDCISSLFSNGNLARPDDIFIMSWATGLLARSLAISVSTASPSGLSVAKRRIQSLESSFATRVLRTAALFLSTDGTLDDLIAATLLGDDIQREELPNDFSLVNVRGVEGEWEQTVSLLRGMKNIVL
jgi:RPAP1-like, N-terminal